MRSDFASQCEGLFKLSDVECLLLRRVQHYMKGQGMLNREPLFGCNIVKYEVEVISS